MAHDQMNIILYNLPECADFDKPVYDEIKQKWKLREQLYPENRGYKCHYFASVHDAVDFYIGVAKDVFITQPLVNP